jgi:hypothetical protein
MLREKMFTAEHGLGAILDDIEGNVIGLLPCGAHTPFGLLMTGFDLVRSVKIRRDSCFAASAKFQPP